MIDADSLVRDDAPRERFSYNAIVGAPPPSPKPLVMFDSV